MNQADRGFDFIRVSIETRLGARSIVVITSALATDGSSVVAAGLAEVFAGAGKRTLLVTGAVEPVESLKARRFAPVAGSRSEVRANLTKTSAEQLVANLNAGKPALFEVFGQLRESYDVVIVDAEPMPASAAAYELAREADAVLVAVRLGRKPRKEDQLTVSLLADCKANVLGVVPTNGQQTAASRPTSGAVPAVPEIDSFVLRAKRQAEVL